MYISTMTHFLDDEGNIAKEMHKEGREHASFLALIVDTATKDYPPSNKVHRNQVFDEKMHRHHRDCCKYSRKKSLVGIAQNATKREK